MNEEPCTVGKDFNTKTCRWIQSCKPGYSRNKDFKCVKNPDAPKRSVGKEKLGLLKGLFSNENGNQLVNLSSSRGSRAKRLKRSKKNYPSLIFNENGNEIPALEPIPKSKVTQSKLKSMKDFLKTISPSETLNWGQIKALARSKGVKLDTNLDKRTFKDLVVDFASGKSAEPSKSKKVFKTKKVHFNASNFSKAQAALKNNWAELNPSKGSSASKRRSLKSKPVNSRTNSPSKRAKAPSRSREPRSKPPSKSIVPKESAKSRASKSRGPPKKSLSKMTINDALQVMRINEIYTMDELTKKYREISFALHPDKTFDEKKTTPEFKVLDRAFEILQKRIDKSGKSKPVRKSKSSKSKSAKAITKKPEKTTDPEPSGPEPSGPELNNQELSTPKELSIPSDETILNLYKMDGLYNPETVFKFYSNSADRAPGKGAGEKIKPGDETKYGRLSEMPDWRKMLSNFWIEPFELDGKRWQSVEHYYQGSKFKGTPDFYNQFSLDSGSEISKDPNLAKAAGGKTGKRKGLLIRAKEIKMDSDFFPERSKIEMYKAQHAKFTQIYGLARVLKLTRDAKLVHHVRGSPPVVFDNLMYIRSKL